MLAKKNILDKKLRVTKTIFVKVTIKKENRKYLIPDIYEPDFYVYNTIEDIRVKYDRQLETAKIIINKKDQSPLLE